LHLNTAYHPQTDGQIKVVNKCLETYLRCFSSKKKNQWAQWLPLAKWWYNTSYHTTTRMTPFEAVYGQKPPSILSYLLGASKVQVVDLTLTAREAILCTLKDNLFMAQNHMKQQADQGRSERQFAEGGQVFHSTILQGSFQISNPLTKTRVSSLHYTENHGEICSSAPGKTNEEASLFECLEPIIFFEETMTMKNLKAYKPPQLELPKYSMDCLFR
jgi:hypothetical protein